MWHFAALEAVGRAGSSFIIWPLSWSQTERERVCYRLSLFLSGALFFCFFSVFCAQTVEATFAHTHKLTCAQLPAAHNWPLQAATSIEKTMKYRPAKGGHFSLSLGRFLCTFLCDTLALEISLHTNRDKLFLLTNNWQAPFGRFCSPQRKLKPKEKPPTFGSSKGAANCVRTARPLHCTGGQRGATWPINQNGAARKTLLRLQSRLQTRLQELSVLSVRSKLRERRELFLHRSRGAKD